MNFILINLILILIGISHHVFPFSYVISRFISISLIGSSLLILKGTFPIPTKFKRNLNPQIFLLSLLIILILIISFLKNFQFINYTLKFTQILVFLIPSFYIGINFFKSKKALLFINILFLLGVAQFSLLAFNGYQISGCLLCLDNYIFGMRLVPGVNLMSNAFLDYLLIHIVLLKSINKIEKKDINIIENINLIKRKLERHTLIIFLLSLLIPSRQLFFALALIILFFFSGDLFRKIKSKILKLSKGKINFNFLQVSLFIPILGLIYFILSNIYGIIVSRVLKNFLQGADYSRYAQIEKGFNMFLENPFLGIPTENMLSELPKGCFENSYIDLLAKFGIFPMIIISILLTIFILLSIKNKIFMNAKIILVILFVANFNETIIEPIFWVPIFFSYGLEKFLAKHEYFKKSKISYQPFQSSAVEK